MKNLYIILIVFINLILQVTLYNFIKVFDVVPNVALILVVLFSLTTNVYMGGFIGLFTGLLYDVLIMDIIGINALIYFIVGVTLGNFSEEINRENKLLFVFVTAISTIFYHLATVFIMFFLRMNIANIILIVDKIIIQIVIKSLLCILVQRLINYLLGLLMKKMKTWKNVAR